MLNKFGLFVSKFQSFKRFSCVIKELCRRAGYSLVESGVRS